MQRCNCGEAACKSAKVSAGKTSWPVDKLTGGQGGKDLAQRETGDRMVGWGMGRAWLSEPAVGLIEMRTSVRERTARRAVPTLRGEVANIVDRLISGPVGRGAH